MEEPRFSVNHCYTPGHGLTKKQRDAGTGYRQAQSLRRSLKVRSALEYATGVASVKSSGNRLLSGDPIAHLPFIT